MMPQNIMLRQFRAHPSPGAPNTGLRRGAIGRMCGAVMIPRSPLEDPENAAFAWARYKRLMRFMGFTTAAVVVIAVVLLYAENGLVSIHFYIATALGIGAAMLLMSALMGLVFLSSGTGHDDSIVDPLEDDDPA